MIQASWTWTRPQTDLKAESRGSIPEQPWGLRDNPRPYPTFSTNDHGHLPQVERGDSPDHCFSRIPTSAIYSQKEIWILKSELPGKWARVQVSFDQIQMFWVKLFSIIMIKSRETRKTAFFTQLCLNISVCLYCLPHNFPRLRSSWTSWPQRHRVPHGDT